MPAMKRSFVPLIYDHQCLPSMLTDACPSCLCTRMSCIFNMPNFLLHAAHTFVLCICFYLCLTSLYVLTCLRCFICHCGCALLPKTSSIVHQYISPELPQHLSQYSAQFCSISLKICFSVLRPFLQCSLAQPLL